MNACLIRRYCHFTSICLELKGPEKPNLVRIRYSRHADEGRVAAVEEGAVDDLQDEGEVLERQVRRGGAH